MTEREEALLRLSPSNLGDMIYKLTKGEQVEYVAVSHDSCVVGVTEGISHIIRYGDNAHYWLATPINGDGCCAIAKLGWNGEKIS